MPDVESQPTASELAHPADAAEAGKSDLSKATPPNATAQAADVGIRNRSIEFVSNRSIGGRPIPILRYRRHGKAKKPGVSKHPG